MCTAVPSGRTRSPGGVTLLEVLISCGLLIVGLSAISMLLPAAGARLGQAAAEDRAALMVSNAAAEIFNRGLVAVDVFPAAGASGQVRTLAFGNVLGRLPMFSDTEVSEHFVALSATGTTRCGSLRTFVLEDGLVYDPPQDADTPVNTFARDGAGLGPRKFREGICWGATLRPQATSTAGRQATLSIVVFKHDGEAETGQLAEATPMTLTRVGSCYEADLISTGSLLRGCSWVLAIPSDTTSAPRWFKIMSSWTWKEKEDDPPRTRIILTNQDEFAQLTGSGSTATVIAFEGILRVENQVVTLR